VGDRVNVDGRKSVFFVLNADGETRYASLLPNDNGPTLDEISVDRML
jgi:hypothetical protein